MEIPTHGVLAPVGFLLAFSVLILFSGVIDVINGLYIFSRVFGKDSRIIHTD